MVSPIKTFRPITPSLQANIKSKEERERESNEQEAVKIIFAVSSDGKEREPTEEEQAEFESYCK